jgi:hypothetical protein
VFGHFGFRVVLSRVGSDIGSFSVRLFWIMDRIRSERVGRVCRMGRVLPQKLVYSHNLSRLLDNNICYQINGHIICLQIDVSERKIYLI